MTRVITVRKATIPRRLRDVLSNADGDDMRVSVLEVVIKKVNEGMTGTVD